MALVRHLVQDQLSMQFGLSFSVWWVLESCQSVVSLHDIEGCRPPALSTTLLCLNLITASRPCHYSPEQPSDGRPVRQWRQNPKQQRAVTHSLQTHIGMDTDVSKPHRHKQKHRWKRDHCHALHINTNKILALQQTQIIMHT